MNRHLNLVESDFERLEKRNFPRFPLCYLTFKMKTPAMNHALEIRDLSLTGMQIQSKFENLESKKGDLIDGKVHWNGREVNMVGIVQWVKNDRLGIEFHKKCLTEVKQFFTLERFAHSLKPLHKLNFSFDLPGHLKYWLRADGPCEIFVWRHLDGELSKFQILLMENFVEWTDGHGINTGRIISKRDVNTPLFDEDELIIQVDNYRDKEKLHLMHSLLKHVSDEYIPEQAIDFLSRKLV